MIIMGDMPSLIIKANKTNILIIAKYKNQIVEHDIQLKLLLSYYWKNNLPFAEKFLELLESVIKRSLRKLFPYSHLFIKYNVKSNDSLEEFSMFNVTLIEVKVDDVDVKLMGNVITFEGIDNRKAMEKMTSFRRKINETIEKEFVS